MIHVQVAHSRKSFPSRFLFYSCSRNVKPCWISLWLFLNLYSQKCRERHQARVRETLSDWDQRCCVIAGKRCLFSVVSAGALRLIKTTGRTRTSHLHHHESITFSAADPRTNSPSDVGGQKETGWVEGLGCITNGT